MPETLQLRSQSVKVLFGFGLDTKKVLAQDTESARFRVEVYATLHEVRVIDPQGYPKRHFRARGPSLGHRTPRLLHTCGTENSLFGFRVWAKS